MQGAPVLRSEAYLQVRRNDEGCSATPQMDFLQSHQYSLGNIANNGNALGRLTGFSQEEG